MQRNERQTEEKEGRQVHRYKETERPTYRDRESTKNTDRQITYGLLMVFAGGSLI